MGGSIPCHQDLDIILQLMRLLSVIILLDRTLTEALQITQDTYFGVVWKNDMTNPMINENWWWRDIYLNLFFDD